MSAVCLGRILVLSLGNITQRCHIGGMMVLAKIRFLRVVISDCTAYGHTSVVAASFCSDVALPFFGNGGAADLRRPHQCTLALLLRG
jgi:hypothetical protein